jgi:DNA replication protein DnaC
MQRLSDQLTIPGSPPATAGRPDWTPPADDAEFYARVRKYGGDVATDGVDPALIPEPPCDWCHGNGYVVRRKSGMNILEDEGRVRPCGKCLGKQRQVNYERIGIKAVLTFADWRESIPMRDARKACDELLTGKRWALLISAGTGRGKTHLAVATVVDFAKSGKGNALFRTAPDLFEEMRDAYDPSATYSLNSLVQLYESRDLLVIDDLGSEYHKAGDGVDWIDEKLFRIVDSRYQRRKRTLITTNLRPDSPKIPARIRSRMAGCEVVVEGGADYRRSQ